MKSESEPLLALPHGKDASLATLLMASSVVIFYLLYGGASYVSRWIPYRIRVDLPFEAQFPFVPEVAVVYLSTILLLSIAPFVIRPFRELLAFFIVLYFQTIVCAVVFVAVPIEPGFPPRIATGMLSELFVLADMLNLERNELPSLHVAFSFTTAAVYQSKCGRWARVMLWCWLAAVAVSTVLMHEHHLADIGAGMLLASLSMRTVYPWAQQRVTQDRNEKVGVCHAQRESTGNLVRRLIAR